MKRDLKSIEDLTQEEILKILKLTEQLKSDRNYLNDYLKGKTVGLIFQKPSNRTRVSFDVGAHQLGGNCIYLGPTEINLGVRESTSDVSKTLSRFLDCMVARTNSHSDVVELSENSSIPVINGLSDLYHPCQGLTDIFSIKEKLGTLRDVTVTYVGDGNNVCHSLLLCCSKLGVHMNVATPKGHEMNSDVIKSAETCAKNTGAKIKIGNSPKEAVKDTDVIYADTWVSMGQEEESKKRLNDFDGFQINQDLASLAKDQYIFMHCLPAHRGQEVTEDVIDGDHSIIFDQAENRMHTQKAIMIFLLSEGTK